LIDFPDKEPFLGPEQLPRGAPRATDPGTYTGPERPAFDVAFHTLVKGMGLKMDAQGKSLFFAGEKNLLFVKGTPSDLDAIETMIQALASEPVQHMPATRPMEIPNQTNTLKENAEPISRNDSPQLHIKARFYKVPERFFTGAMAASLAAAITNGVGVLTAPEAKSLQQHLNSYHRLVGVETLAEPEVTTTSGRQTQMRATEVLCVITNFLFDENPTNLEASISPQTEQIETGPIFDVVPNLLVDGRTVNLFAIPSVTEFIGYADCTNLAPDSFTNSAGETGMLPVVLPAIKLSRETTTRNLFDGQSLVLFPKSEEVLFSKPNKGRDERVAEHIRKWEKSTGDKRLMVVVTVDIVDSAGNRFYGDGDWAFSQDQIPAQPPN
jgi:hypothetical protein